MGGQAGIGPQSEEPPRTPEAKQDPAPASHTTAQLDAEAGVTFRLWSWLAGG